MARALASQPGRARRPLPAPWAAVLVAAAAALALLPLPYNVAAVVGLATVALTLLRPVWGLYLVMLSVPAQDVGAVQLGTTAITATKVLVPLALITWLALRLAGRGAGEQGSREARMPGGLAAETAAPAGPAAPPRLRASALALPYGLYVAALAGSTSVALDQMTALTETARWVQAFGVFLMTLDLVRTRRELAGLVAVLLLGGAFQAGVGLAQSVIGAGPASFAVAAGFSRAYGTFGMPNSYAGYLEMSFPLALALSVWLAGRILARRPDWRPSLARRAGWLAVPGAALLLLAGIAASYSRGAWLGTAIGAAAMVALAGRRSLATGATAALLVAALLGLGGAAVLPASLTDRLATIGESIGYRDVRRMVITPDNWAVAERLAMWEAGLSMFRDRPIYGVGAGNFNVAYPRYRVPQFVYSRGHAHNYYIHVAAETGMIGLAAYALVLAAAWVDLGRALRRLRDGWLKALAVGAAGVLAAVMTHQLVENLHVLNMNLHLFAALALPALALHVQDDERRAGLGERGGAPARLAVAREGRA
jgi:O-antigen ligase